MQAVGVDEPRAEHLRGDVPHAEPSWVGLYPSAYTSK